MEGAFDNLSFSAAKKALKAKGVDKTIRKWYLDYLCNRTSIVDLKGVIRQIEIEMGTPQGGIISVILWNMAFDLLLNRFRQGRVKSVGFADDLNLLITGKTLPVMEQLMQKAMTHVENWAEEMGLRISVF